MIPIALFGFFITGAVESTSADATMPVFEPVQNVVWCPGDPIKTTKPVKFTVDDPDEL